MSPQRPSSATAIPSPLLRSIARTIDEATRVGPIVAELLNGSEKLIVIPYFGYADDQQQAWGDFNPGRGDGEPILTFPSHVLYVPDPYPTPNPNIRASVPFLLIATQDTESLCRGIGTVKAIGYLFPRFNSAMVDFYHMGLFRTRQYLHDPRHSPRDLLGPAVQAEWAEVQESGASLYGAAPPFAAPLWLPRMAKP